MKINLIHKQMYLHEMNTAYIYAPMELRSTWNKLSVLMHSNDLMYRAAWCNRKSMIFRQMCLAKSPLQ